MANSVYPNQTAPSGAVRSGSTLFLYVILSDALVFEILGHLLYREKPGQSAHVFRLVRVCIHPHGVFECVIEESADPEKAGFILTTLYNNS